MNVQAEFSLYPLRTTTLADSIDRFLDCFRRSGLSVDIGPMSSRVAGNCEQVIHTLGEAFQVAAGQGDVVLTLKLSNACPPKASDLAQDSMVAREEQ